MSRIGSKPVPIPKSVQVGLQGRKVSAKGPEGELSLELPAALSAAIDGASLSLRRSGDAKREKSLHGLYRALVRNMFIGVSEGFQKTLIVMATRSAAYKVELKGKTLSLHLGYTLPVELPIPDGVKVELPAPERIVVKGIDKQKVGAFAALIRAARKPDVYRDRGVRYEDEQVRRIKIAKPGVIA